MFGLEWTFSFSVLRWRSKPHLLVALYSLKFTNIVGRWGLKLLRYTFGNLKNICVTYQRYLSFARSYAQFLQFIGAWFNGHKVFTASNLPDALCLAECIITRTSVFIGVELQV